MRWTEILLENEIANDLKNFLVDQIMFLRAQTNGKHQGIDLNKVHATMVQNGYDVDVEGIKKIVDDYFGSVEGVERDGEMLTFNQQEADDKMVGGAENNVQNGVNQEAAKQRVKNNAVQGAQNAIDNMTEGKRWRR